jgi:ATP-dependent Clp protease ATP-binding subunit ClpB
VIIMTSNVGSQYILENMDEDWDDVRTEVWGALREQFRPEFLNRVDDIILFRPLDEEHIEQIIDLQLERLRKLLADRKLSLELTPEARHVIAQEGYDRAYGARPLKRAIQRLLQNPLAMAVLEGRFGEGDTVVVQATRDGELAFEKVEEPAAAGAR